MSTNCTGSLDFAYHGAAAIGSSILIGLLGFGGAIIILWRRKKMSNSLDSFFLSFGAGAMLSEAVFHIIPEVPLTIENCQPCSDVF
jgi:zinc transporter ZupT